MVMQIMVGNPKHRKLPHHVRRALQRTPRKTWHPIIHHVRRKYRISRRTIFYLKEYGPKSHVSHVIIKESIRILILASILSSIGGIGLQSIEAKLMVILPLLVMLPALNDMIGDFGTIVSSRFATMLYLGRVERKDWWRSPILHRLFHIIIGVAVIAAIYVATIATWVALSRGFAVSALVFAKVVQLTLVTTLALVGVIFFLAIVGGLYIFSRREDPNNFLIPMTTSVADLGSMLVLTAMAMLVF